MIGKIHSHSSPEVKDTAHEMRGILARLNDSLKIQDSSAHMMAFLVQDFLDYAQIKSGKFRINLKAFNILESVKKVISIQNQKAEDSEI